MIPVHSSRLPAFLAAAIASIGFGIPSSLHANVVLNGGGLVLAEEGGTFDANNLSTQSGTAFALDVLAAGTHSIAGVNDGGYGNAFSWIGNSDNSWVGVGFGAAQNIQSIAFGRDNTNGFADRSLGLYTLQYTTDSGVLGNPGGATWTTIGTLDYQSAGGPNFANPHLRHRYNFDEIIGAYAVRLIAPGNGIGTGTAIDEIELYSTAGAIVPPPSGLVTTSAPGFSVSWDGNDGDFFDPASPAVVPNNLALGGTAFASSVIAGGGIASHQTAHLNDGLYGNSNSWIGGTANAQAGIDLGGLYNITSLAFGRDNGNNVTDPCPGGECTDRSVGLYTLEVTTDGINWTPIGTVDIRFNEDLVPGGGITTFLRHEFDVALDGGGAITASGVRITASTDGIAIDEIEIYGTVIPEPGSVALVALGALGLLFRRRR